ncbi:MAG: hypothetical protein IBJ00_08130 [Alphaproteobacteria bacterium]|nr:hypothetical protein [Alphaproteobacteria bacterium]
MKKILFTTFSAFACMLYVNSAFAWGDPICDAGCNRKTCGITEVQNFCKSKCAESKIKNCLGYNKEPVSAKDSPELKGAVCAVINSISQLKPVASQICN